MLQLKLKLYLELAMESHPNHINMVGEVSSVPSIGDYVSREESGWTGYVKNRRWEIRADGSAIDIRVWLHRDPP